MTQYRIYFIAGETLLITAEEFKHFRQGLEEFRDSNELFGITSETRTFMINKGNITHILSEETDEAPSTVVTPPTPQQLKSEQEQATANQDISLDAQLENAGE